MPDLRTYRPRGPRIVAYVVALIMVALTALISTALPDYVYFSFSEKATIGALLLFVVVLMHGVGRSFVRVAPDALTVRNGYRTHVFAWAEVAGVLYPNGAPWPTLVISDDERVMLFAIQRSDGAAEEAVAELRGRLR